MEGYEPVEEQRELDINGRRKKQRSCAECRRLKLKCDRRVPCSSCTKRGCSAVCPDGTLVSHKGNRLVLSNTTELHAKIEQLSGRIRELEDALAKLHNGTSDDPHPLLRQELLLLKLPPGVHTTSNLEVKKAEDIVADAFGTLQIADNGGGAFFGGTAGSEFYLEDSEDEEEETATGDDVDLPTDILMLAKSFPWKNISDAQNGIKERLMSYLPPFEEASRLCQIYFDHAAWLYSPMTSTEFSEEVFGPIYRGTSNQPISPTQLALFFIALALGVQMDLDRPPYDPIAETYHQLCRASLALIDIETVTMNGIRAIHCLCYYLQLTDKKDAIFECSIFQGVLVKMAQSIGLHRDSGRWKLSQDETERRRRLFWEVYLLDMWLSFGLGRPPGISSIHVDCQLPLYEEDGRSPDGYHHWKHKFGRDHLRMIVDKAFQAGKAPSYATILRLDADLRDNCIYPEGLRVAGLEGTATADHTPPQLSVTMQRHALYIIREACILYLHRGFVSQALHEGKADPLWSKYAPSVLAAYRSACNLLTGLRHAYTMEPGMTKRLFFLWTHAYTATIIFAGLVSVAPGSSLAAPALLELDNAWEMFEKASDNLRVARFKPNVAKLRAHSHRAFAAYRQGLRRNGEELQEEMKEWPGLAGMTRLVSNSGKKDKIKSETTSRASSQDQKTPSPQINNTYPQPPPNAPLAQGPQPQYTPVQQSYQQHQIVLDPNGGGARNNPPGPFHSTPPPYTQLPPAPHSHHTLEQKTSQQQLHSLARQASQQQLRHRPSQLELQPQRQPQQSQQHVPQYAQSQFSVQTPPEFANAHRTLVEYYIELPHTIRQKQQQIQASYPMSYSTTQEGRGQHQRYQSGDGYTNATQQQHWNQQVSPQQPQPYTSSPYQDYAMYTDAPLEPTHRQYHAANGARMQHSPPVHTMHSGYYSMPSSSGIMAVQASPQDAYVQSYSNEVAGGFMPTSEEDSPDSNWNHLVHHLGVG